MHIRSGSIAVARQVGNWGEVQLGTPLKNRNRRMSQ